MASLIVRIAVSATLTAVSLVTCVEANAQDWNGQRSLGRLNGFRHLGTAQGGHHKPKVQAPAGSAQAPKAHRAATPPSKVAVVRKARTPSAAAAAQRASVAGPPAVPAPVTAEPTADIPASRPGSEFPGEGAPQVDAPQS